MRKPGGLAIAVFVLALVVRFAATWKMDFFANEGFTEVENLSVNLATTGEYANPFGSVTGPSAHAMPVYPLYLAALFAIFGVGTAARLATIAITILVSALRCALVPLFALDAGLEWSIAALAGGIGAVGITALRTEVRGGTDGAWLSLVLLAIIWISLRIWRAREWESRTPWRFVALCGFATLLDAAILPVIAALVVAGWIASGRDRRFLRQTAILTAGIAICLIPWTIRNYVSLGAPIVTRSNFGMEFRLSNGPGRGPTVSDNYEALHPTSNKDEAAQVLDMGEVRYNRIKLDEALDWIRENPAAFLVLTAQRFLAWWFPPTGGIATALGIVLTLLALAGMAVLWRRHRQVAWLFLITWIAFPAVYYAIQWTSRYRYPMDWQLMLCASVAIMAVVKRAHSS